MHSQITWSAKNNMNSSSSKATIYAQQAKVTGLRLQLNRTRTGSQNNTALKAELAVALFQLRRLENGAIE